MYQLAYNATTRVATYQTDGDALPAGSTKILTYGHDDVKVEDNDENPAAHNHVHYHHIRDALYHLGVEDMSTVTIVDGVDPVAVVSISVTPANLTQGAGTKAQLATAFTPAGATDQGLTYESSDTDKVNVSETGLVHFLKMGEATITVTTADGFKTDTVAVTVT